MTRPLRILLIEDSERDAALLKLYLRRGGFEPLLTRIETADELQARLAEEWDIIISDVRLPRFGAVAALRMLGESGRQLPFIALSGEVSESVISEVLNAGARRFVNKDAMRDIAGIVEHELRA